MISGQYIKKLAENAGFDLCGITPCKHLAENESYFREWLAKGYGSSLEYLERNLDKRFDVRHLVEGAQTVVVCAVSYKNPLGEGYPPGCRTKIASYARSRDYHPVLKRMLGTMLEALRRQYPGLTGRTFVDTAPLLEKQLAVEAGLGWIGRQSLLLTPQYGSYVLLGELVLTLPSDQYDAPFAGARCGRCRNCLDSCPTGAIVAPKVASFNFFPVSSAPRKIPVVPQMVAPASSSPYFAMKSLVIKDPMLCPNKKYGRSGYFSHTISFNVCSSSIIVCGPLSPQSPHTLLTIAVFPCPT